jgi:hypothetical protein
MVNKVTTCEELAWLKIQTISVNFEDRIKVAIKFSDEGEEIVGTLIFGDCKHYINSDGRSCVTFNEYTFVYDEEIDGVNWTSLNEKKFNKKNMYDYYIEYIRVV